MANFPAAKTMTAEQWERVKQTTADALEQSPVGRTDFVNSACADDPRVLREVLRLVLQAEVSGEAFLSDPPWTLRSFLQHQSRQMASFSVGQVVSGRFRIDRFLNRGGMGEVYAAFDVELQETVALKTIRPAIASSPAVIERFKSEVKQTRRITHPNVCRVFDLFSHVDPGGEPLWFLTMELLDGRTLGEFLADRGPLPLNRALPLIQGMVAALSTAHDQGIVHRDFKPNNVMLVGEGTGIERAVVTDFGLALSVDSSGADGSATPADGTPAYMAPEQAAGATVGLAADQFALGLVMAEMQTGTRPALRASPMEWREQLTRWFRSPAAGPLAPRVQRVIRRCLEFRPEARFKHVREILPLLDGSRLRFRIRVAIGSAAALAALAVAVALAGTDWDDRVTDVLQLTPGTDLSGPPSLSGDGQWVTYGSDRADPSNLDVWVQPARGGPARRLTTNPADDVEPAISFDGKLVAFRSERDGGGIYIMQSDGTGERLLAPGGRNPAFSPDGRWIAYWTGLRDDSAPSARLFLISPSGGSPQRVAADFADARYPVWNTKGNLMLFEGCRQNASPLSTCADWWAIRPGSSAAVNTGVLALLKTERIEMPSPPTKAWRGDDLLFSGIRSSLTTLWRLTVPQEEMRFRGKPSPNPSHWRRRAAAIPSR
jgi:serine/threonine protein kinase